MGIGYLMAENFARRKKCKLVLMDIREDLAGEAVSKLKAFGSTVSFYKCDVSKTEEVEKVCDKIKEEFGFVDILINNAGIVIGKNFDDLTVGNFHKVFDVNYFGCVNLMKQFLPLMKQKNKGHIVNVSSILSQCYSNHASEYVSSKWALFALHSCLRLELKRENSNIATTVVCPYHIATGMFSGFKMSTFFGLFDSLKPETVADAVYFGILKKKEQLFIYWYLHTAFRLFYLLPSFLGDRLYLLLGAGAMDAHVSRPEVGEKKTN
eukprot:CAMPEP_0176469138 /NCGR_PEP_ID=MMETSP0127-20121128/39590_1 /TAXON_ID=938130 /ORGANISM="Platyophrya macrostoma, Strain WH" /LENGTH=264 /DNA_ID=CAMNT_0017863001 /DNA_START=51 /DNA_END=848 /DNA_ORIENTATION=+